MKGEIGPSWSTEEQILGERLSKAWEEFFMSKEKEGQGVEAEPLSVGEQRIAALQARHEAELLQYPNVMGMAPGICTREGKPTGEACLVVYVERKVPEAHLAENEILPSEIDGVPIDVVEVGKTGILPA